jgi:DNA-binding MarR family transcriptional regulator
MTDQFANAQFEEPAIRRGVELLYFGYSHLTRGIDAGLAKQGLGRAHHRALYFIARSPGLTVGELLKLLAVTKQSLGRVLNDLVARELVSISPGISDKRQRLLSLTESGVALEADLFAGLSERLHAAYLGAGDTAIPGFWAVLEGLIPKNERAHVASLGDDE